MNNDNIGKLENLKTNPKETWVDIINDFYTYSLKLEDLLDQSKDLLLRYHRSEDIIDFVEKVDKTIRR